MRILDNKLIVKIAKFKCMKESEVNDLDAHKLHVEIALSYLPATIAAKLSGQEKSQLIESMIRFRNDLNVKYEL